MEMLIVNLSAQQSCQKSSAWADAFDGAIVNGAIGDLHQHHVLPALWKWSHCADNEA